MIIAKGIEVINERYLPRKWRKDVHRPYIKNFFAGGYPTMTEEYKKYCELEGNFEQIIDIVIGNTQKMEYVKRQLRVLKVNLSEWNDGLLASAVGSENVGVANSDSSVAILNPLEARSSGRPRSNRFRSRRELNGGSNRGRSRCRRGRRGHDTSVGGGGQMTNIITQNNSLQVIII